MRRFYVILILILGVLVSSVTLVSCNDDDDTSGSSNGGKSSKRIAKMILEHGKTIKEYVYTYDDKGRVVKIVETENGEVVCETKYTYGEMLINCTETYSNRKVVGVYTIENGLITNRNNTTFFSYDNDKHLISITEKYSFPEYTATKKIYWSNGDIIGYSDWYKDEESGIAVPWTNSNIPWHDGLYMHVYWDPVFQHLGYWGTLPKHMPSKCDKDTSEYTITDGVITKIKSQVYTYKGEEYNTEICTIVWE